MTRSTRVLLVSALAACGGSSRPAPAPAEPPSACVADPATASTRRPKPAQTACMSQDDLAALTTACNADDADACYRFSSCALLEQLDDAPDPASAANLRAALRTSCDGGISEACTMRVAVAMNGGAPLPDDGCADLLRACRLGDEQGCFDCRNSDCR